MLVVGALEFVGPFERDGWKVAGILVPVGYPLWSAWLVAIGVLLLVQAVTERARPTTSPTHR